MLVPCILERPAAVHADCLIGLDRGSSAAPCTNLPLAELAAELYASACTKCAASVSHAAAAIRPCSAQKPHSCCGAQAGFCAGMACMHLTMGCTAS